MTLNELIGRAASAYPDGWVLQYWNTDKQRPVDNPVGGDTLANFIALELYETFDPDEEEDKQLDMAIHKMKEAAADMAAVAGALEHMKQERIMNHGRSMLPGDNTPPVRPG